MRVMELLFRDVLLLMELLLRQMAVQLLLWLMVQIKTMEDDFLLAPIMGDQLLTVRIFLLTLEMVMLLMLPMAYGLLVNKVVDMMLPMV